MQHFFRSRRTLTSGGAAFAQVCGHHFGGQWPFSFGDMPLNGLSSQATAPVLAAPGHCSRASAAISMSSLASIPWLTWLTWGNERGNFDAERERADPRILLPSVLWTDGAILSQITSARPTGGGPALRAHAKVRAPSGLSAKANASTPSADVNSSISATLPSKASP